LDNIKKNFSIRDLENISGIKAHTIRIWEKRYNLLSPERSKTNIRYYSHQNLQKLLNIVLLNNNNYKISKISEMNDELINITARELAFNTSINDDAINSLKLSMFKFDKVLFNKTYNKEEIYKCFEIKSDLNLKKIIETGFLKYDFSTIESSIEYLASGSSNDIKIADKLKLLNLKYIDIRRDGTKDGKFSISIKK